MDHGKMDFLQISSCKFTGGKLIKSYPLWFFGMEYLALYRDHLGSLFINQYYSTVYIYILPIAYMYGIFTYIYQKDQPNVGNYTIHGWYGL